VRRFGNKLYYGDASRLECCVPPGPATRPCWCWQSTIVEASVRTAELARRHFPHLQIIGRARNRQHAFRLMDVGVEEITRETLASSPRDGAGTLVALGTATRRRPRRCAGSAPHDEETLRKQAAIKDDEEKIIATTQASASNSNRCSKPTRHVNMNYRLRI
jgi:hypothetical protein